MDAVGGGVEFEWDEQNIRHLRRHGVAPQEFEELVEGTRSTLSIKPQKTRIATRFWERQGRVAC